MDQGRTDLPPEVAQPQEAHVSSGPLPQNLESAQALIAQLAAAVSELQDSRQQLTQENEELKLLIAKLMLRLQGHRSERLVVDPNQLKLDFQDDPEAQNVLADASAEAEQVIQEYLVRRKLGPPKPPRNEQLPAHLPRYDVELPVPEAMQNCPTHGPRRRMPPSPSVP